MLGFDVYWLGVDCNIVGYYNLVVHYRLGYKWVVLEYEYLRDIGWLDEEDLVNSKGQLSSLLPSSSLHCDGTRLHSFASIL